MNHNYYLMTITVKTEMKAENYKVDDIMAKMKSIDHHSIQVVRY